MMMVVVVVVMVLSMSNTHHENRRPIRRSLSGREKSKKSSNQTTLTTQTEIKMTMTMTMTMNKNKTMTKTRTKKNAKNCDIRQLRTCIVSSSWFPIGFSVPPCVCCLLHVSAPFQFQVSSAKAAHMCPLSVSIALLVSHFKSPSVSTVR